MDKETIKDFYGRVLGYIETDSSGNRVVKDFYGRVKGKYDKKANVTRDFYNVIVGSGDLTSSLLYR